jgi:transcription initiation factor TFIID subunit 1
LEQHPTVLNNVGMGLALTDYYRQRTESDLPSEPQWGATHLLHPTDDSPFVGDLARGSHQLALCCAMFRAPCHPHVAATGTDFLLIHSLDFLQATIRPAPSNVVLCGQQQPLWEVPAPATKGANEVVKQRLTAFVYRWFRNDLHKGVLQIEDVRRAFPTVPETGIRKRLSEIGRFIRGGDMGGWWLLKDGFVLPPEEEVQRDLPPESVCAHESMLAAQARLKLLGIVRHFNPQQVKVRFVLVFFFLLFFLAGCV